MLICELGGLWSLLILSHKLSQATVGKVEALEVVPDGFRELSPLLWRRQSVGRVTAHTLHDASG